MAVAVNSTMAKGHNNIGPVRFKGARGDGSLLGDGGDCDAAFQKGAIPLQDLWRHQGQKPDFNFVAATHFISEIAGEHVGLGKARWCSNTFDI